MSKYSRFFLPILFMISGIAVTIYMVNFLLRGMRNFVPSYDLIHYIQGNIQSDVLTIISIMIPIYIFEFVILALPISIFMLIGNKLAKITAHEINIMNIGSNFKGFQMIKRAVTPSLFALSSAELVLGLVQGWLFSVPELDSLTKNNRIIVVGFIQPLHSMLGALMALALALAIFMPTWILNDAGIIYHLKSRELENRRCPDTLGVGRWYSNYIGGFALLAFPFTMFVKYFYVKFVIYEVPLNWIELTISLFWTVGLPLLVMAFAIPLVILNELTLNWTSKKIQSTARKLGAKDVELEHTRETSIEHESKENQHL